MSLPKLTSISTQTLSLLLERQRLQSLLRSSVTSNAATQNHPIEQIKSNLLRLRNGILELESKEENTEATRSLRDQYERMRDMLGKDAELLVVRCVPDTAR
jgi:syntaxin 8